MLNREADIGGGAGTRAARRRAGFQFRLGNTSALGRRWSRCAGAVRGGAGALGRRRRRSRCAGAVTGVAGTLATRRRGRGVGRSEDEPRRVDPRLRAGDGELRGRELRDVVRKSEVVVPVSCRSMQSTPRTIAARARNKAENKRKTITSGLPNAQQDIQDPNLALHAEPARLPRCLGGARMSLAQELVQTCVSITEVDPAIHLSVIPSCLHAFDKVIHAAIDRIITGNISHPTKME